MNSLYQRDKYSSHKSHKCYILLFFTLGSDQETLENIIEERMLPFFSVYRKFWVFSGSLNWIMVLWSIAVIQRTINVPIWFFTGS